MLASFTEPLLHAVTYVVPFLAVLLTIVFVHELGHFAAGRACGIAISTFSLGFGHPLASFTDRHGTRWQIASIPLGGYVRFADETHSEGHCGRDPALTFRRSALWKRFFVVAAGPMANFLFAALIYAGLHFFIGVHELPARVDGLVPGSPAAQAGLRRGDVITAVDGWTTSSFREVERAIAAAEEQPLTFAIERDGKRFDVGIAPILKQKPMDLGMALPSAEIGIKRPIAPIAGPVLPDLPAAKGGMQTGDRIISVDGVAVETYDDVVGIVQRSAGKTLAIEVARNEQLYVLQVSPVPWPQKDGTTRGRIGVGPPHMEAKRLGAIASVVQALDETCANIMQTVRGIRALFTSSNSAQQVGGPILMAEATAEVVRLGPEPLLVWLAMLSANLGFFNLLPIPVLDGGHLFFYAIEAVRRRPLSPVMLAAGYRMGFALIIGLMVYANLADLMRIGRRFL